MSNRYIALLHDREFPETPPPPPGLQLRTSVPGCGRSSALSLYTSEATPVLEMPDGGLLIGHLFNRSGVTIVDITQLPKHNHPAWTRDYLLQDCWGDYIAIQPSPDHSGFTVMNSPSCANEFPCLYSCHNSSGFIASDISLAIHFGRYRKHLDWDYIAQFLTFPFIRTERTALVDICELLPGMEADFHRTGVETRLVWTPWNFVSAENRYTDFGQAMDSVQQAVSNVVRALAYVDKAILLELSGGLDSSIVGSCLRDTGAVVSCATLIPPVPGADERQYASLISHVLEAELRSIQLPVEAADFSFVDVSNPVRPSVGPLQHAIDGVMGAVADMVQANSAFSGGGGDAVFGYLSTAAPAVDAWKEHGLMAGLRSVNDLAILHQCSVWRALQLTVRKSWRKPGPPYQVDTSFLMPTALHGRPLEHPWFDTPTGALPGDRERIFSLAGNQIFLDYVPRRTIRPFRMPLLSQPVIEACLRAPSWMWISGGQNRAVARAAFANQLPAEILSRRSKGTFMNYLGEAYQQRKKSILDFLLSGNLHAHGIVNSIALRSFMEDTRPPHDWTFTRVLDLCRVENWTRQHC